MAEKNSSKANLIPLHRRVVRDLGATSVIDVTDGLPDGTLAVVSLDSANHASRATDMADDFGEGGLRVTRGPAGYEVATWRDSHGNNVMVGSRDGTPDQLKVSIPSQNEAA